ncbi:MAG: hypothetical protein IJT44_03845 [Clostridia bacterium]|nr:hypothetical protein [Clostridia bacterium]
MEIIKEKKFCSIDKNNTDEPIAVILLENGVWILSFSNGTALGTDGQQYVNVSEEVITEKPKDSILNDIGWTTDSSEPVIL